jgi:regulator of protease activity HflC (stomatin/prohibitin superfamily)
MSKLAPWVLVAQKNTAVMERLGRFSRVLEPGLNFKIPFIDTVAYRHSLKEQIYEIPA